MESTRRQMVVVALMVCLFAVGMAGLLNYFKYRGTAERITKERLVVTGKLIENSIQSSLALGLQFSELGTLPGTMERERAADDLILGIDVFDTDGRPMYSTDRLRATRAAPAAWLAAAKRSGSKDWFVHDGAQSAAGISIENNFGLTIGYLALRYSAERLDAAAGQVGRQLALAGVLIFAVSAALATLLLMAVMRGVAADVKAVEAALQSPDTLHQARAGGTGLFGHALRRFVDTVRQAEAQIAELRGQLQRGAKG
jgi:hypothetical protein